MQLSKATSIKLQHSTQVTTGVFDPRSYRDTDPNWARRRRSDWLSFPGTIRSLYTRLV